MSRLVLAGASGLLGRPLAEALRADGVEVTTLVRRPAREPGEVRWDPASGTLDEAVLAGADAVVNLGGASISRLPWTPGYKRELVWSRVTTTRVLADALARLGDDAPALVSASAVGYYGARPQGTVTESTAPGDDFLAKLCVEWERAAHRAPGRVSTLRIAPVVHRDGVLKPMIALTRAGLGGPLGPGTQVWPWIGANDAVRAIRHVIDAGLEGAVNLAGPTRAVQNDLGFALAVRLNRPYLLRAPAWALPLAVGRDAARSLLLTDAHVVPDALARSGFVFETPTVQDAVAAALPEG